MKCFQMNRQGKIMISIPYKDVGPEQDGPHRQTLGQYTAMSKLSVDIGQATTSEEACGISVIRPTLEYGRQQYSCLRVWRPCLCTSCFRASYCAFFFCSFDLPLVLLWRLCSYHMSHI